MRTPYIVTAMLCMVNPCRAQIISSPDDGISNGIVSSVEDQNKQEQFLDWSNTLGLFGEIETTTQEELQEKINEQNKSGQLKQNLLIIDGKTVNLPTAPDENGTDLYMLTEEGITIYMAMLGPVYLQETNEDIIKWIRYYAYDNRERTKAIFRRYEKWEPFIKSTFRKYGVPEEIAELCIVESGCTKSALSSAGARGMWQIMPETGREWGMIINDEADERLDPMKSTVTAARILQNSYRTTKDWTMCIAGYNCGMGRTRSLIRENDSSDWRIIKYKFPKETQQYIPSLLAVHYVWQYRKRLGL